MVNPEENNEEIGKYLKKLIEKNSKANESFAENIWRFKAYQHMMRMHYKICQIASRRLLTVTNQFRHMIYS